MFTDKDAGDFFDRFSETFDTLYDEKRSPFMQWVDKRFRSDMFIRFSRTFNGFGDLKGKTILDLGCGSGPYILEAFKRGAEEVTGLDPAPNMLELVRQRLEGTGFENRCKTVESLFPCDGLEPHDHAIVMGVMDYVNDPAAFFNTMRPLIKVSAAISFPSRHFLRTPIRQIRYKMRKCPLSFYHTEQIEQLLKDAGFTKVMVHKIPGAGMDYHVMAAP